MRRGPIKPEKDMQHVSTLEWTLLSILLLACAWWINYGVQPRTFFACIFIWLCIALWAGSQPREVIDDD